MGEPLSPKISRFDSYIFLGNIDVSENYIINDTNPICIIFIINNYYMVHQKKQFQKNITSNLYTNYNYRIINSLYMGDFSLGDV